MQKNEAELSRINTDLKEEIAELDALKGRLKNEDEEEILKRARQLGLGRKNEVFTLNKETLKDPRNRPETAAVAPPEAGARDNWFLALLRKLPFGKKHENKP